MNRRSVLHLVAGAAVLPVLSRHGRAQVYPSRPVRIIVGFTPGGGVDVTARLIAQWLSGRLGQPFTVENRPGANTNIGTEVVVRAAADGYTLLLANAANASSATLYDNLSFDFLRDIAPVGGIMRVPLVVVVNPLSPAKTVLEFIGYARRNPGEVTMASGGNGAPEHMAGELFKMMAKVDMLHVPYRGAAPALTRSNGWAGAGHVCSNASSDRICSRGAPSCAGGDDSNAAEALPDVPTVSEFVSGYEASQWYGIGAPRNTPPEVIDRVNKEINAGLSDVNLQSRFVELGGIPTPGSPGQFGKLIADETEKWGKVIRAAGIKVE